MGTMRKLIVVMLLAIMASLGTPHALADGVAESPGITAGVAESPGIISATIIIIASTLVP